MPATAPQKLKLLAGHTYVYPSGYKVEMAQSIKGQRWRLVGTQAEGTFCHKPCTVSGGGKSEICKALSDAMITGPVIVGNFADDMAAAQENHRLRLRRPLQKPATAQAARAARCSPPSDASARSCACSRHRTSSPTNTTPGSKVSPATSATSSWSSNAAIARNGATTGAAGFASTGSTASRASS